MVTTGRLAHIRLALRLLWRSGRSPELRLLLLALVLAVMAVTAVGFFTDRVNGALTQAGHRLLGADLLLTGDYPLPEHYRRSALVQGVQVAETRTFPSMVMAGQGVQLAEIKAVSPEYPLRGTVTIAHFPRSTVEKSTMPQASVAQGGPMPGTVWVDDRLRAALGLSLGDLVQVGQSALEVAAWLVHEPDRAVNFIGVAPRLMMALADLPATGLEQPGARIRYRFLLAGSPKAIAQYQERIRPQLQKGERLESSANARQETRNVLEQAERFLRLAALLTVLLAAAALVLAVRRYLVRQLDQCALMRCFGATQRTLILLYLIQSLVLALVAAGIGGLLGFGAHFVLAELLGTLLRLDLPPVSLWPLLQGLAVALVLALGCILPPLLQLANVPTLRVLRRELGAVQWHTWLAYVCAWLALSGLIVWMADSPRLGGMLIVGFSGALLLFWWGIYRIWRFLGRSRVSRWLSVRLALSHLRRHAAASSLQTVALALGLMALLLLGTTRTELLAQWQARVPVDAPNTFVINLQPDQRAVFTDWLLGQGIVAELAPMVRGRLVRIGSEAVTAARYPEDERAQRLVSREFNLSWRQTLPPDTQSVAGVWFPEHADGQPLASVEAGLAKTLGIQVGDQLTFSANGQEYSVTVQHLRQVSWDSMRVNFFVLTPPGVFDAAGATYITSFYVPESVAGPNTAVPLSRARFAAELAQAFPNLTLIDISSVLAELKEMLDQVVLAVQFVFGFSVLAGILVLVASLYGALEERRQTFALLRALGARRRDLRQALFLEMALSGGLAGAVAALGATLVGQAIAERVLELHFTWQPALFLFSILLGAGLALGVAWRTLGRLLDEPPARILREA